MSTIDQKVTAISLRSEAHPRTGDKAGAGSGTSFCLPPTFLPLERLEVQRISYHVSRLPTSEYLEVLLTTAHYHKALRAVR
eukprot:CAMPEP_0180432632 /NCGR_PEP_ID=MMETSP1036_2-20121128/9012_1 /TAXON_ID=632150 /ORGANISM="Azadinium spinosum, Strain 3D9" /LENGTH=80 /DNA_ID=CAMNT_0022438425 /DNA_START=134 /DNA_END=376 /DNA_ORIENTATION=-